MAMDVRVSFDTYPLEPIAEPQGHRIMVGKRSDIAHGSSVPDHSCRSGCPEYPATTRRSSQYTASTEMDQPLTYQLATPGRMFIPVGEDSQGIYILNS